MVASNANLTCAPALATILKLGFVAAPFIYLGFEKQFAVPHNSLIPESAFISLIYSTIVFNLFSDSIKLEPSLMRS